MRFVKLLTLTDTSPATASTAVGDILGGLAKFDFITVDATLTGATGGTLDVYLQRELGQPDSNVWADWYHFAQVAAEAAATHVSFNSYMANAAVYPITVGIGTATVPAVALAAGTLVTPTPGMRIRYVFVAGAGTSAGAAQTVRVTGWEMA